MPKFRLLKPLRLLVCIATLTAAAGNAAEEKPDEIAAPPTERPTLQSRSDTAQAALREQLPAHEQVELKDEDSHFLALWLPANVGEPKGLVIMLPSEGESADAPGVIGSLRRGLADDGWHTLSISLPDPDVPAASRARALESATEPATETATAANPKTEPQEAPEAPEAEAPSSEAGYLPEETAAMPAGEIEKSTAQNEARPIAYPERISARITAALSYAQARNPGSITLFGHGTGAYWASHYLHEQTPQDIQQLVIVQPRKPESQEQRLDELASGLELATADLYYKGNAVTEAAANTRRDASKRVRHPSYTQVRLQPSADRENEQVQLQRRVRGWLDTQGAP